MSASVPTLTRSQIQQLDREAVEQFHVPSILLMENAGRGVADTLESLGIDGPVVLACGRGNNAGDALVVARHLDLRGYTVRLLLVGSPEKLGADALVNWRIVQASGLPALIIQDAAEVSSAESWVGDAAWLVDGLLGTGARGSPRSPMDHLIRIFNGQPVRRLAIDLPTGLDCDTGQIYEPTFQADHTCALVAAKPGLLAPAARPYVGRLHVLDIGAPRRLVQRYVEGKAEADAGRAD